MSGSHCCLITLTQTLTTDPFGQALLLTAPEKSDHCVWACSVLPQYTMVCSIPTLHAGKKLKQKKKTTTTKTYRPRMKTNEKLNRTQRVHRSSRTGVLFPAVLILIFWISSTEPLGETGLEVLRRMSLAVGGWGCGFEVLITPAGWHSVSFLHYDTSAYGCRKCLVPNEILYWIQFLSFSTGSGEPWLHGAWMFHPGAAAQGPETRRTERR